MNTLQIEADLALKYKYKPLPKSYSEKYRKLYFDNIPEALDVNGSDMNLYSSSGTLICKGYNRIVIGDYGAFIEFTRDQSNLEGFKIKEGQEWRGTPKYTNCKYVWLTTKDDSDCKIYLQLRTVTYADYKVGIYYISPHEVVVKEE